MSSVFTPRTAVVTIWAGDDLDQIRFLERQADAAKNAAEDAGPRLNDEVPEYLDLARRHDELVREARDRATEVQLQALPRRVWRALVAAHPPRTVAGGATEAQAKSDALSGFNDDTFAEALIGGGTVMMDGVEVPHRTVVSPDLTAEDLDALSDADFERLYINALALNRGHAPDPKGDLVSRLTRKNDETSS